ncbi:unnamed protein product, partial [Amoebophrya sp. A25]
PVPVHERHVPLHPSDVAALRDERAMLVRNHNLSDFVITEYMPGRNPWIYYHDATTQPRDAGQVGDVIVSIVARTEQEAGACGGILFDKYSSPRIDKRQQKLEESWSESSRSGKPTFSRTSSQDDTTSDSEVLDEDDHMEEIDPNVVTKRSSASVYFRENTDTKKEANITHRLRRRTNTKILKSTKSSSALPKTKSLQKTSSKPYY